MIPGFEDYTVDLKRKDIKIAHAIAKGLKKRIGKDNAIKNYQISKAMKDWNGEKLSSAKIRKIIQYIRSKHLCLRLCASSKGYYIAETNEEWEEYKKGFKSRLSSMIFTYESMMKE